MTIYRSYDFLWLQVVVFKMQFKIHSQSDFFQTKTELLFFLLYLFIYLIRKVKVKLFSRVRFFVTPWNVAYHTLLSMGFSRQEYWSGLPLPSPEDFPDSDRTQVSCIVGRRFTI